MAMPSIALGISDYHLCSSVTSTRDCVDKGLLPLILATDTRRDRAHFNMCYAGKTVPPSASPQMDDL